MSRRNEAGFRHGLRVRIGGASGPRGVLHQLPSKFSPGTYYWRVRLTDDTVRPEDRWAWPDHIVVDGPGTAVSTCRSCELPFLHHAGSGEMICDRCNAEQTGRAVAPDRADTAPRFHTSHYLRRQRRRY